MAAPPVRLLTSLVTRLRQPTRLPWLQIGKSVLAVALAWVIAALLLGQPEPTFAAIAALLVMQPSINQSFGRGLERSVGVVMGVGLAYLVVAVLGHQHTWVVLVAIVVAMLFAWLVKLTPTSATQVPISAMLVLVTGLVTPGYAVDRIVETVIGAIVALAVNTLVAPPVLLGPAHLALGRLARDLATAMDDLAGALEEPVPSAELDAMLVRARELRSVRQPAAEARVRAGAESLTLNPRATRQRRVLEADRALLATLTNLSHRMLAMTRSVRDNYEPELTEDVVVDGIAEELRRASHDVRLLVREREERASTGVGTGTTSGGVSTATADLPALTAPLSVVRPDPARWVLIGSLLEDLRRIREEIVGDDPAPR
ncbi:FUSC family protein [Frondihabitans australicus]|uniref:Fusaric acid resistance family protein n=1 Tax=Frondihabitans australicus TaxID=386892 RepID=A0A495IHD4_9MICO|nr:FUSC family protein [Frondihabitans australicus]RKR74555.1 fusaric acid resistance family protein [Frondihabitans australicus]